jgi:hypothetical protein
MITTEVLVLGGQILLKYGPEVAKAFMELFSKQVVTLDDWDKVLIISQKPLHRSEPKD